MTNTGGQANAPFATVTLPATSTLTAGTLRVGFSGASNAASSILNLGQTTTIQADTISVASGKGPALIQMNTGLISPSVTFVGSDGVSPIALVKIGDYSEQSANSGTADSGTINLNGAIVNASIANLEMGIGKSSGSTPATSGTLLFDGGHDQRRKHHPGHAERRRDGRVDRHDHRRRNRSPQRRQHHSRPGRDQRCRIPSGGGTSVITLAGDINGGGGSGTVSVTGGTLAMADHTIGATNPISTIVMSSGQATNVHQFNIGTLNATGGTLTITPGRDATKTSIVRNALTITAATVNLNDNDLIWNYTNAAPPTPPSWRRSRR